jgi:hypothetical protein
MISAEVERRLARLLHHRFSRLRKNSKYVIPKPVRFLNGARNLLFPWLFCEKQIPHPQTTRVRDDRCAFFRSLLGVGSKPFKTQDKPFEAQDEPFEAQDEPALPVWAGALPWHGDFVGRDKRRAGRLAGLYY